MGFDFDDVHNAFSLLNLMDPISLGANDGNVYTNNTGKAGHFQAVTRKSINFSLFINK
jgi:hypothetical protein